MNAVAKIENTAVSAMTEGEMLRVLESSLYPGAQPDSIKLVLGYCKAAGLDPMQKPVHIVPISVKQGDKYVMRDTVMPGIGLYRTQAARTGEYAGITEPEFGPDKTMKIGEFVQTYPEWCRVTVKRLVSGHIVEFTAKEFWLENYATKARDSKVPNAMWQRRGYGQLAKCTEAQALRKAFPELGAQPTADETIIDNDDGVVIDHSTSRSIDQPRSKSETKREEPSTESGPVVTSSNPPSPTGGDDGAPDAPFKPMIDGQKKIIRAKLKNAARTEIDLEGKFGKKLDATDEKGFAFSDFASVQEWLGTLAD